MREQDQQLVQLPQLVWGPALGGPDTVVPAHVMVEGALSRVCLKARGHIIAMQECYETTLVSERGSVFIMYGATHQSKFVAGVNIFVKHAEDATLEAAGDIIIEDSVRGSRLRAGRKIISESDKGRALGGCLTAQIRIELQALGSPAESATEVNVAEADGIILCRQIHPGVTVSIGGVRRVFRLQAATGAFYRKIFMRDRQLFLAPVLREVAGDGFRYVSAGTPELLQSH